MNPTLVNFGDIFGRESGFVSLFGPGLPSFFVMLVLAFAGAIFVGVRVAKRSGLNHHTYVDFGLFIVITGVLGARALHVLADGFFMDYVHLCTDPSLVEWRIPRGQCTAIEGAVWDVSKGVCSPTETDCFAWAKFWNGGLAYYGGLIASTVFGLWFFHREKFPVLKGADMAGLGLPVGLFFGRLGCFLGGCCFGAVHEGAWSIRFPAWSSASRAQALLGQLSGPHLASLPVHPTQLYESFGCLLIGLYLILWRHPRKRFDGQAILEFLGLYAVLRFGLEYIRADDRGSVLWFSTSQWIGLVILVIVAVVWFKLSQRTHQPTQRTA